MGQRVAILGASNSPERYAFRAQRALKAHGHVVIPVTPKAPLVDDVRAVPDLTHVIGHVDTLTVYVSPSVSDGLIEQIVALRPGRVIFNPGAENPRLAARLTAAGLAHEDACTLVLLATGQF